MTNEPTLAAVVGLESPTFYEKRRAVNSAILCFFANVIVHSSQGGFCLCFWWATERARAAVNMHFFQYSSSLAPRVILS